MKTRQPVGFLCPASPDHGPLLEIEGRLRCIHQSHDGRPTTHKLGAAPMTKSLFSLDEAIAAARSATA